MTVDSVPTMSNSVGQVGQVGHQDKNGGYPPFFQSLRLSDRLMGRSDRSDRDRVLSDLSDLRKPWSDRTDASKTAVFRHLQRAVRPVRPVRPGKGMPGEGAAE